MPRPIFNQIMQPVVDREDMFRLRLDGNSDDPIEDNPDPLIIPLGPFVITLPDTTGGLLAGATRTLQEGLFGGRPPPVVTYQWQKNTLGTFADVPGAVGQILSSLALGTYRVAVTATSSAGSITVYTPEFIVALV